MFSRCAFNTLHRQFAAFFIVTAISLPSAWANTTVRASSGSGTFASKIYWLDWSGLNATLQNGPGTQAYTFTLADGSTLSMNLTRGGPSNANVGATTAPTFFGSAIGNDGYLFPGGGNIALYSTNAITNSLSFTLSNIVLTNPGGTNVKKFEVVMADSESMDSGDGAGANITFATTGGNWELIERVPAAGRNAVVLSGLGTQTVVQPGSFATNVPAWILGTANPSSGAFNITATMNSTARQGIMMGIRLGSITLNKNILNRANATDQFTYRIKNAANASVGSGSGTCTTVGDCTTVGATTGNQIAISAAVAAGNVVTLEEVMAPGSVNALSAYNKTISCSNTNAASLTVLPANGPYNPASPPQINIQSALDNISCTLSNAGTGADMRGTGAATQTTAVGVPVSFITSCTNDGPQTASLATCTVAQTSGGAVGGLSTVCTPATPVANLAVGATISCTTTFTPATAGVRTFTTTAASATADNNPANDVGTATTINVGGVTATPDASTTTVNTAVSTNVVANDVSATGFALNPASVTLITPPGNGAVVCNTSGLCTYTPNNNFEGVDTYVYRVCDTSPVPVCANSTVTITVNPLAPATSDITAVPVNSRALLWGLVAMLIGTFAWQKKRLRPRS